MSKLPYLDLIVCVLYDHRQTLTNIHWALSARSTFITHFQSLSWDKDEESSRNWTQVDEKVLLSLVKEGFTQCGHSCITFTTQNLLKFNIKIYSNGRRTVDERSQL